MRVAYDMCARKPIQLFNTTTDIKSLYLRAYQPKRLLELRLVILTVPQKF